MKTYQEAFEIADLTVLYRFGESDTALAREAALSALEAYSKNPTREAFIDGMLAPLKVAEVNLSRRLLDGAGI